MTIAEILKQYNDIEADLLLGAVLNKTKEFLYLHPDKPLTKLQEQKFVAQAKQRRKGMPAAYLLGYKYFYGLKFKVTPDVLIPRPETEWLVEKGLGIIAAKIKRKKRHIKVLDLATGSGCIAISIAKHAPKGTEVTATDISPKALLIAKANAKANKVKVKYVQSNLFKKITSEFDVIIANLPYVPLSDYKKHHPGLKFEPKNAITDGGDTFKLLKQFLKEAPNYLSPGGAVIIEVDPKFFKAVDHTKWRVVKDYKSLNRYALINGSSLKKKPIKK